MSKIFGYTKKGGKDWFSSDAYSDKEIEAIKDPEGGSEISLPTAIPSPFARIDLVKTAFRNIAKTPDLKAYTKDRNVISSKDDEKLVSDALDLTEMLFNIDSIKEKIKIIVWDREAEITKLKGTSDMHRRFAETLELYLDQDKESYNFDLVKRLYLIEYNHNIVGCTSPATLCFATANDLSKVRESFSKDRKTFTEPYAALYERDEEFQRYMHTLFEFNPLLQSKMQAVNEYLKKNLKILETKNPKLHSEIKKATQSDFERKYSRLDTNKGVNDAIDVIGIELKKRKKEDLISQVQSSDFLIQSTKSPLQLKPLALQNNFTRTGFKYVNDEWNRNIQVPYLNTETIYEKRKLPEMGFEYPYLTVSDFLEPYLIRLVYPINKEKFFDGNVNTKIGDDSKGYILPLKKQFFDFFTSDDLTSSLQGKPRIEMEQLPANAVKVTLSIPIAKQGESISFERVYYQSAENQLSKPDEEKNKGVIVEHQFGVTLFPFIKTNNPNIDAYYRVQLVDRDVTGILKNTDYDLKFYSNNDHEPVEIRAKKIRSSKKPDAVDTATSQYYVLHNEFDFIQVRNLNITGASGMILPNWQPYKPGNEIFSFAIDFGTTNTHIEYKVGSKIKPFDITQNDIQIATLFDPNRLDAMSKVSADAIYKFVESEFIPAKIGSEFEYRFPQRTVLSESQSLNIATTETETLADFNIPFIYEKYVTGETNTIHPNLKWSKKEIGNTKRIRAFFEKLIMMMRNKVLFNHGNLAHTRIVWFYPSSMNIGRKAMLENEWKELFKKYFAPNNIEEQIHGITESIAPFYFFKDKRKEIGAFKPAVSIDIGGGTTDTVVYLKNKPLLFTSFKFAANSIFGDGFSEFGNASSNGIVRKYLPHYQNLINGNKLYELEKVLTSIVDKKTEDINAFFFSIENNPKVKDKKLFSYNSLLSNDEDLKILFIYFYTAIIFHIAELMKQKQIGLPKHLIFSGTGSKILGIITSDTKILSELSKQIFEEVYNQKFDSEGLTIETEKDMPKEVTCKGGLMSNPEDLVMDVRNIKSTLTCLSGVDKLTYEMLNDSAKGNIADYVGEFNKFFFKLNSQYSFTDYFNVSEKSLEIFKGELNKHLRDYLEEGLEYNKKLDEVAADEKEVAETLFFYPLIGAISNLSSQLSVLTPVNN